MDFTFVQGKYFVYQRHTDTMSGSKALVLSPIEGSEEMFPVGVLYADTVIREADICFFLPVADVYHGGLVIGEFTVVFYQVSECCSKQIGISHDSEYRVIFGFTFENELNMIVGMGTEYHALCVQQQFIQPYFFHFYLVRVIVGLGQIQQSVYQAHDSACILLDVL